MRVTFTWLDGDTRKHITLPVTVIPRADDKVFLSASNGQTIQSRVYEVVHEISDESQHVIVHLGE